MLFHGNGKVTLDHIYTSPDPRLYFRTLRKLDYCIPQLAKPYFAKLIEDLWNPPRTQVVSVLDIGCSYGINAALLRCDMTMDELYDRYGGIDASTRTALLTRDRELVRSRDRLKHTRFIGLDISHEALSYAHLAGFVDSAVHADLEQRGPTAIQREQLAGTDLVISTGCLGYVGERTISRLVRASGDRPPWMAHFVLRMYPFEPVAECLVELGYDITRVKGAFKQRRFASSDEQALVLDTLSDVGVNPRSMEADGWLYAQLFVCRPSGA
jgi:SAM-dependent methyltransferase